jgi:hypothetical protein
MVMLRTAFDASVEKPSERFLVLAGFISDDEAWKEFDIEWRKRLAVDDVPYFHMNPFAMRQRHFKGWSEDRRQALLGDLLGILSSTVYYKFGVVVDAQAVRDLCDLFEYPNITMLEVAGSLMVMEVEQWRVRNNYQNSAEHVFEDGDVGKGRLSNAVKMATGKTPIFKPKKDIPEKGIVGFTPLQASDILAYEIKKAASNASLQDGRVPRDYVFRFPYQELNRIQGQPHMWSRGSSVDIAALHGYFKSGDLVL